jgi:hypothetical protein
MGQKGEPDTRTGRLTVGRKINSTQLMGLRSTQPLTEMSTRNIPGGEGRPVHKADNFTAICEPTV